jgi:hypothetical protein
VREAQQKVTELEEEFATLPGVVDAQKSIK